MTFVLPEELLECIAVERLYCTFFLKNGGLNKLHFLLVCSYTNKKQNSVVWIDKHDNYSYSQQCG